MAITDHAFKKGKKHNPGNCQQDTPSAILCGMEYAYPRFMSMQKTRRQPRSAQIYKGKSYLANMATFYDKIMDWEGKKVTVSVTFTPLRHLTMPSTTFLWLRNFSDMNSLLTGLKNWLQHWVPRQYSMA